MSTIYYSIIRYVPDLFRKEFVNIGAIVVDPSSRLFKYYFADDEQRLKYFYPSFSKDDIVRFKEYIIDLESKKTISFLNYSDAGNTEYSVATKEFLEEIGRMNIGNKIQLTMPYWADLETNSIDDETLITFLDDLVNKYIRVSEGPKIISEKTTYLKTTLREEFQRRKYLSPNNTFKKHKIVTNYQTAKFDWYYDFALKNRRLHLFETLDLTKRSIESAIDSMKESALTYMKFAGANAKLGKSKIHNVTILNANHKKEKEIKRELDLLHGVSDVYNYQSKIDKKKFFNEIEKAMGIERLDYDF